ncbi:hypothetical protein [Streptomyces cavernicola]
MTHESATHESATHADAAPESTPASAPAEVTAFPTARHTGCPFDPPAELSALREELPLRRMRYPDGHRGWLATGHGAVRAIMADPRFSARYELLHVPMPGLEGVEIPPAAPGDFTGMDAPDHTRYRRLLRPSSTSGRAPRTRVRPTARSSRTSRSSSPPNGPSRPTTCSAT